MLTKTSRLGRYFRVVCVQPGLRSLGTLFVICLLALSLHAQGNAKAEPTAHVPWWKGAVVYEVYPRSFQDSNGDGIGDLRGIIQRLDYLQSLHVDAIWLTPIYPSPQVDFGYDIADYKKIDPMYGTMQDFDDLVKEAGRRNIKIVMDMVLNHTSDQDSWFQESKSSRTNPKADWYVWRDGPDPNTPPNNWLSLFGHSAWEYVPARKQFYYHRFYKQQPDLNWRNPEVEKAMFDACRFWLDRGVAGFRLDAVPAIFEDPELKDAKNLGGTNAYGDPVQEQVEYMNRPEVHPLMRRLRALLDSYGGDRVLIGETNLKSIEQLRAWYGAADDELQLPMDLQMTGFDRIDAAIFAQRLQDLETRLGGNFPLVVFDNHDRVRSWDRYGNGTNNPEIARLLATLLLTLRDSALMYYGQELGMVTTPPKTVDEVQDPIGRTGWPKQKGRDGERTPMQWDSSANAGFSTAPKPWLPVPTSQISTNVKHEDSDPNSLLRWYRTLLALRASNRVLRTGDYHPIATGSSSVLSYVRSDEHGHGFLVLLNFSGSAQQVSLPQESSSLKGKHLVAVLENAGSRDATLTKPISLPPFASMVLEVR